MSLRGARSRRLKRRLFSFARCFLGAYGVPTVILRIQALLMLLLFGTGSLFGQLQLQLCLCTGALSIASASSSDNQPCCPSENEDGQTCPHEHREVPSPCDTGDCCLVVALAAFDQPATFQLRDLESPFVNTPQGLQLLAPPGAPRASGRQYLSRPPDPPRVALTVLYSKFLI